jgi:hypothetical protein
MRAERIEAKNDRRERVAIRDRLLGEVVLVRDRQNLSSGYTGAEL